MNGLSIRTKITIWFIGIIVVALGINFAVFFIIGERVARETAKDDLREMSKRNVAEVRHIEGKPDEKTKDSINYLGYYGDGYYEVDNFLDLVSGVASGIYTRDGKLIYGLDLLPNETRKMKFVNGVIRQVDAESGKYYMLDRMVSGDTHGQIWIRCMVDRAQDRDRVYRMYRSYLTFVPIMIMLAALITYMVAHRALSPIDRIADAISNINREADLSYRVRSRSTDYEIRTIVNALNHMLARLEKSYEATRRFTANVSHDLRTPTSIILANTELALEEDIPDDVRETFESIEKQGERIKDILDSLLTYSRLENAHATYETEKVDISEAVASVCRSFRVIREKNITFEEDIQEGIVIDGNKSLIQGLVENLLSNAFKYTQEDGRVKVSLLEEKDIVRLSVEDSGVGIDETEQEKIFDWMYRVDEEAPVSGSGLGLFIVKSIVQFHEAEIKLESRRGEGSTFIVEFPKKMRNREDG